ncbi:hypothetical protein [Nonomuraea africana]|uniref:GNAT family N-acetyltransferase n=1 Tax=Nonomuraea africana TaxID=46171 RepID=A0ABR9KBJ9_9ACTN|nr:hypothetical protein [Nonomuraea africana]MBE1559382.1 hypothetical protein [Nonomuraea africana]
MATPKAIGDFNGDIRGELVLALFEQDRPATWWAFDGDREIARFPA